MNTSIWKTAVCLELPATHMFLPCDWGFPASWQSANCRE